MHGYRITMEDTHKISLKLRNHSHITLVAVFDGHGGKYTSSFLARTVLEKFEESYAPTNEWEIKRICFDIDNELGHFISDESGSTACIVLIDNNACVATIVNIGDSRAIVFDPITRVVEFETKDHKPTDFSEFTRITRAGGFVQDGRVDGDLALSRAFGDFRFKPGKVTCEPTITRVHIDRAQSILVCCDGLLECLSTDDLVHHVAGSSDPADSLIDLLHMSLKSGSQDNMTAVLVQHVDGSKYGGVRLYSPMRLEVDHFADDMFISAYTMDASTYNMSLKTAIIASMTRQISRRYSPPVDNVFKLLIESTPENEVFDKLKSMYLASKNVEAEFPVDLD